MKEAGCDETDGNFEQWCRWAIVLIRSGRSRNEIIDNLATNVSDVRENVADEICSAQLLIRNAVDRIRVSRETIGEVKDGVKTRGVDVYSIAGGLENDLMDVVASERMKCEIGVIERNKAFIKKALKALYVEVDQL